MTKQDIIDWKGNALVCELRDGAVGLLVNQTFISINDKGCGGYSMDNFNDDLTYDEDSESDVMKLYEVTEMYLNADMKFWSRFFTEPNYSNLIWERDESFEKETDFSDVVTHLHEQARKKESKALEDIADNKTHDGHVALEVARSLRIVANYLDGVSAS